MLHDCGYGKAVLADSCSCLSLSLSLVLLLGVYSIDDESCGKHGDIDHGVLAVGYGTDLETQKPYWLVKNSWGETWGDAGYVKLARGSKNEWGMCAILKMSSFPIVE